MCEHRVAKPFRTMKTLRTFLPAILVFLVGAIAPARAEKWVTLPVDLDQLRGAELLQFIRATVPEVYGGSSRQPHDLATLAILYGHFVSSVHADNRERESVKNWTQQQFEAVLRTALAKVETPELRRLALGDGRNTIGIPMLFPALCQRWIEAEVKRILSERKPRMSFPADPVPMPENFGFSQKAGLGVAEFKRAMGPFAALMTDLAKRPSLGLSADGDRYDKLTRAFLMDQDTQVASELLRFQWDSSCGTGEDQFEGNKMMFVFMGLLRERRLAEALGVSFLVPHAPEWLHEARRPFETWRGDLLKWCGFDPDVVMLGAQDFAYLAASGSEKAAQAGVAVLELDREAHERQPWRLESLAAFLIPGGAYNWEDADPRKAISQATQARIIELLNGAVREDTPFHELDRLLKIFENLCRPETKPALHRILQCPSTTYAERAAWVLRVMGETINPIEPAPPVRVRIYLNDEPWRSVEVSYAMINPKFPGMGMGSLKTDAEGFGTIPRDEFLDPAKRGPGIRFAAHPWGGSISNKKKFEHPWMHFDRPWVQADVVLPQAFDEVIRVRFTGCELPIEIAYAMPPPPVSRAPAFIRLIKVGEGSPGNPGYDLIFDRNVEPPVRFIFSTIAPGTYRLSALVAGSARFLSDPIEVEAGMAPVAANLEKGCHIYASVLKPENARGANAIGLFRDGVDVSDQYTPESSGESIWPIFAGVPKGSYKLRVLSTEEFMGKYDIKKWQAPEVEWGPDARDGVDCAGVSVDFTIDDSCPALLDLGKLENKPIPAMAGKAGPMKLLTDGPPPP